MKLKIRGALFHCGRCRKSYSNPFGHQCVSRMDRKPGKTAMKPKITASLGRCPKCHRDIGNPLTHTCTVKTDFKKRRAAAARKPARPVHLYEACMDRDCQRPACRAFKDGREEGYVEGYQNGDDDGYVRGYDKGFPDGIAACPREHK